jgi:hypothetical protein
MTTRRESAPKQDLSDFVLAAIGLLLFGMFFGSFITVWTFWLVAASVTGVIGFLKVKRGWNIRFRLPAIFLVTMGLAALHHDMLVQEQRLRTETIARDTAAAAARVAQHQREAIRNHERRLAWNLAHPVEVARRKAEAKAKADAIVLARRRKAAAVKLANDRKAAAETLAKSIAQRRVLVAQHHAPAVEYGPPTDAQIAAAFAALKQSDEYQLLADNPGVLSIDNLGKNQVIVAVSSGRISHYSDYEQHHLLLEEESVWDEWKRLYVKYTHDSAENATGGVYETGYFDEK